MLHEGEITLFPKYEMVEETDAQYLSSLAESIGDFDVLGRGF